MPALPRAIGLIAAILALAALPTAAAAVTWDNLGDTTFSASSPSVVFTAAGVNIACVDGTGSGTAGTSGFSGLVWTAAQMTLDYVCTIAGTPHFFSCSVTFTASAQSGGTVSGTSDQTCTIATGGTTYCHVDATAPATYINPSGGATGRFTLTATTSVRFTDTAWTCPYRNNGVTGLSAQTVSVTSGAGGPSPHAGPVLTRTP
jgi:hypothetical protein